MATRDYAVGILGHAARSRAIVITDGGRCVRSVEGAGVEWQDMGPGQMLRALEQLLDRAAEALGLKRSADLAGRTRTCAVALSGIDLRFETEEFFNLCKSLRLACEIYLSSLPESAHWGAFLGAPGLILRCGHGTSACTRGADGTFRLRGGWGGLVSDQGSGAWLGLQALTTTYRVADGLAHGSEEDFAAKLLVHRHASSHRALVRTVHGEHDQLRRRRALYSIGESTIALAAEGDAFAARLVSRAETHLVELAATAVEEFSNISQPLYLVLRGGIIEHYPQFCAALIGRLLREIKSLTLMPEGQNGHFNPLVGVGLLAMGLRSSEEVSISGAAFLDAIRLQSWALPHLRTITFH